ncbi:tRNA1(Val) (adenine(37)-N6)-methyltransferase [Alteromonas sp. ASW11-130]|uniref:tRNA1(Val) (adenine(37)-N6)-methyltransferase n=1 Tax=Alteromonas sp. ASW11-130 TaxID=3015775 RepID=UPI002241CE7C|nr:methyltransferase [Alteromonas sp. ASW11-130]MCW8092659.1 methyltransferase [Alteromonas sp. ASW11-130]
MKTKGSVFACKQFVVEQQHCAMKVNTDSMILGSWASPAPIAGPIVDIGTGSGILALMMAQKKQGEFVVAIEIDTLAARQAASNFAASPWAERLNVLRTDLTHFEPVQHYATIISNPPYFAGPATPTNAYKQQVRSRELARTACELSPAILFNWVSRHLKLSGYFYCLYPAAREEEILTLASAAKLSCEEILAITHSHKTTAHVLAFKFHQSEKSDNEYQLNRQSVVIRNKQGQYSNEFKALCREFYLHF